MPRQSQSVAFLRARVQKTNSYHHKACLLTSCSLQRSFLAQLSGMTLSIYFSCLSIIRTLRGVFGEAG